MNVETKFFLICGMGNNNMKTLGYMARDQYGQTYHIGDNPPRKWLLNHFGRKHADKMYTDGKGSEVKHIGYIIATHWLTVYRVCEWKTEKESR